MGLKGMGKEGEASGADEECRGWSVCGRGRGCGGCGLLGCGRKDRVYSQSKQHGEHSDWHATLS